MSNERERERKRGEERKGEERKEREPLCSSSENAIHESPLENYQQKIKKVSGKRRISPEVASNRGRDNTALPKVRGFSILGGSRRAEERRGFSLERDDCSRREAFFPSQEISQTK